MSREQTRYRPNMSDMMDVVVQTGKAISGAAYAANVLANGLKDGAEATENLGEAFEAVADKTSGASRTTTEAGLCIDRDGKKPKLGKVTQQTPVGFSSLNNPARLAGIGAGGTEVLGNKTSPPIQLKLGTQFGSTTSIENFLSLFNQTGTISSSFGGRLLVPQDERYRVFHCFRHNLHNYNNNAAAGTTTGAPYPTNAKILDVQGDVMVVNSKTLA